MLSSAGRVVALVALLTSTALAGCSPLAQMERNAHQSMRALESQLPVGLPRREAYKRIRARGMVAYNPNYAHFVLPKSGLYYATDHGEWPTPGETYPPTIQELAAGETSHRKAPLNPSVAVAFGFGYFFPNCGFQAWLGIVFDSKDRIARLREFVNKRPCPSLGYE
jgi:hypothetical protein